jgi:cytochrome P450
MKFLHRISIIIHRIWFHPLSKFPGPAFLAASSLPYNYYNLIQGTWYRRALTYHEKYGPIVRVAPDRISVDSSVAWQFVYGHKASNEPTFFRHPEYNETLIQHESIFTGDPESHRRQRRVLAPAFADSALYEQEPLITAHVDLMIKRFKQYAENQKDLNIDRWYNFTTFDIIGDLTMGESFGCLNSGGFHPWVAMVFDTIKAAHIVRFLLHYSVTRPLLNYITSTDMFQKRVKHRTIVREMTEKRLKLGLKVDDRKDFMFHMLRHGQGDQYHDEILGNADVLILAGSETTATAITATTYYVCTNPAIMKHLTNEIRSAFTSEDQITIRSTRRLQYLDACMEEALRIYPAAAELVPRISPGAYIGNDYIPLGVSMTNKFQLSLIID